MDKHLLKFFSQLLLVAILSFGWSHASFAQQPQSTPMDPALKAQVDAGIERAKVAFTERLKWVDRLITLGNQLNSDLQARASQLAEKLFPPTPQTTLTPEQELQIARAQLVLNRAELKMYEEMRSVEKVIFGRHGLIAKVTPPVQSTVQASLEAAHVGFKFLYDHSAYGIRENTLNGCADIVKQTYAQIATAIYAIMMDLDDQSPEVSELPPPPPELESNLPNIPDALATVKYAFEVNNWKIAQITAQNNKLTDLRKLLEAFLFSTFAVPRVQFDDWGYRGQWAYIKRVFTSTTKKMRNEEEYLVDVTTVRCEIKMDQNMISLVNGHDFDAYGGYVRTGLFVKSFDTNPEVQKSTRDQEIARALCENSEVYLKDRTFHYQLELEYDLDALFLEMMIIGGTVNQIEKTPFIAFNPVKLARLKTYDKLIDDMLYAIVQLRRDPAMLARHSYMRPVHDMMGVPVK